MNLELALSIIGIIAALGITIISFIKYLNDK